MPAAVVYLCVAPGELTAKAVRRGSFASVADLQSAIAGFLEVWNENPKLFVWTRLHGKNLVKICHSETIRIVEQELSNDAQRFCWRWIRI